MRQLTNEASTDIAVTTTAVIARCVFHSFWHTYEPSSHQTGTTRKPTPNFDSLPEILVMHFQRIIGSIPRPSIHSFDSSTGGRNIHTINNQEWLTVLLRCICCASNKTVSA